MSFWLNQTRVTSICIKVMTWTKSNNVFVKTIVDVN
jgi:hypothetical protein